MKSSQGGANSKVPEVEIVEQKILVVVIGVQRVFVVCLKLVVVVGMVVVVELKQFETQNDLFFTYRKFFISEGGDFTSKRLIVLLFPKWFFFQELLKKEVFLLIFR
jgi:hypothetical protein